MRRSEAMKVKVAQAIEREIAAKAVRDAALSALAANPEDNAEADRALSKAIADVTQAQGEAEALTAALDEAERLDRVDILDALRASALQAGEQAKATAAKRIDAATKLDALLVKLPQLLAEFEAIEAEARKHLNAALPGGLDFGQHYGRTAFNALGSGLQLEWFKATPKPTLAQDIERANDSFARELDRLHKGAGLIEFEEEPAEPFVPIPPPVTTMILVKDRITGEMVEEAYTIDAPELPQWGLPPGTHVIHDPRSTAVTLTDAHAEEQTDDE